MNQGKSAIGSTIVAAVVTVAAYFACLMIVAPALLWLYDTLLGGWQALGNSSVRDARESPTVLSVLIRVALSSGLSAYAVAIMSAQLFQKAHPPTVAAVFGLVLIAWLGLMVVAAFYTPRLGLVIDLLIAGAMVVPPAIVARSIWHRDFVFK